ncbi:hypothetical protein B0J11DRAFT_606382 [Dendryphion nanum]|uniref:Uncharacterized protein n=1 Tax=Dendryphion nanum TaxID=256645 RepID=A0A9P9DMS7_9PLEO|nr:hypothetical protein B0J11DRAFT_606382 [Dendryphion nanum]
MTNPTAPIHSTGRGGAGNIGPDETVYTDGGIVREGFQGVSPEGDYSTGRGGAGNITKSPLVKPQGETGRRSIDYIPENALREQPANFHSGRGGAGNAHSPSLDAKKTGLGDKIKHVLHLDGKKEKHEASPLTNETK